MNSSDRVPNAGRWADSVCLGGIAFGMPGCATPLVNMPAIAVNRHEAAGVATVAK